MNEMMIFNNAEFGQMRSVMVDDEPWFVGKDVAEALGYSNARDALNRHVDNEDRADVVIHDGSQNRNMNIINESGLYALIFGSKLESARKFKRWVTSEVLPSLRKNGTYSIRQQAGSQEIDTLRARTELLKTATELIKACKGDIHPIERLLNLEGKEILPSTGKRVKRLTNDDINSIELYVRSHKIAEGDLVKEVYEKYVNYCYNRGLTPRTRQAFVLKVKDIKKLTGMTRYIEGEQVRIFEKFGK